MDHYRSLVLGVPVLSWRLLRRCINILDVCLHSLVFTSLCLNLRHSLSWYFKLFCLLRFRLDLHLVRFRLWSIWFLWLLNNLWHVLSVWICPALEIGIVYWWAILWVSWRWWIAFLALPIFAFLVDVLSKFLLLQLLHVSLLFLSSHLFLLLEHFSLEFELFKNYFFTFGLALLDEFDSFFNIFQLLLFNLVLQLMHLLHDFFPSCVCLGFGNSFGLFLFHRVSNNNLFILLFHRSGLMV